MPHAPDLSGCALDDRYELHEVIGEGTFGRVYRGRDRRLTRWVAVKVIKPWWSEDPDWVRSFEREAQLLARVNDPGIVQIFDVGRAAEGLYYVAELVDGESLASRLKRGPLPPLEACEIAEELCRALAQAHAQNVVHRDVKPANVLISARGRVKVGDFGVALLAEGSTDGEVATVVGTPRYMSPEQAQGRPATPATDVYSVGVILYEMLAGRPPFSGASAVELALSHLTDSPPPLSADTPQQLVRVVDRALAKDPARRYKDAGAMADALALARAPEIRRLRAPQPVAAAAASAEATATGSAEATATGSAEATATLVLPAAEPATVAFRGLSTRNLIVTDASAIADDLGTATLAPTQIAPRRTPRRNVNPPARRRSVALFASVLLLLVGMAVAATLLGPRTKVRVPDLIGLSRARVAARASHLGLHPVFNYRYDQAPKGAAIAQAPKRGTRLNDGATVRVVLSAGPLPVKVPQLAGEASADAQTVLRSLGLRVGITTVPAPGVTPGTVTRQSATAGANLAPGSTVVLSVAETPRWRELTSFAGAGPARSVPFRIRGGRWRVVYGMGYDGTCTFVFICSGPSATVTNLGGGPGVAGFDLNAGDGQAETFASGPGLYQVSISPGSDSAHWSIEIEDYY